MKKHASLLVVLILLAGHTAWATDWEIVALSSNDIWTAGQYIVPVEGSAQFTLMENWDGSQWNFVSSPNAPNSNNRLHGITATPSGTLWAVGTTGVFARPERTLILRKSP